MYKGPTANYIFTEEQQKTVCEHFGIDRDTLEEWQICELLDRLIDEAVTC